MRIQVLSKALYSNFGMFILKEAKLNLLVVISCQIYSDEPPKIYYYENLLWVTLSICADIMQPVGHILCRLALTNQRIDQLKNVMIIKWRNWCCYTFDALSPNNGETINSMESMFGKRSLIIKIIKAMHGTRDDDLSKFRWSQRAKILSFFGISSPCLYILLNITSWLCIQLKTSLCWFP